MTITLFKANGGWMAQHSGEGSENIIELFETDTLPTPFSDSQSADSVRDTIERLNPGHEIIVR